MKLSQDLLLGIAIGAGAALLLSRNNTTTVGPVIVAPKAPPKIPAQNLPQRQISGNWHPRQAYVADLRPKYLMPAWYAG